MKTLTFTYILLGLLALVSIVGLAQTGFWGVLAAIAIGYLFWLFAPTKKSHGKHQASS